ncbi:hypothetical protein FALCPG4_19041 [Fusarium falciforme]
MFGAPVDMRVPTAIPPTASRRHHRLESFIKSTNDSGETGLLWLTSMVISFESPSPASKLGGASNPAYSSPGELADGNSFGEPGPNSLFSAEPRAMSLFMTLAVSQVPSLNATWKTPRRHEQLTFCCCLFRAVLPKHLHVGS